MSTSAPHHPWAQPYNPALAPAERTNELTIDALCYIYGAEVLYYTCEELRQIVAQISDMYSFVHSASRGSHMVKLHDHQALQECLRKRAGYSAKLKVYDETPLLPSTCQGELVF